jgi:processing peptidase subunit beta
LGRTILGPRENIRDITRTELTNYIKHNYTADRMVLVGAGGVPHEKLVEMADQHFSGLPSTTVQTGAYLQSKKKPDFIGSDLRIRDDTIPTANIAIAVEGVSWNDPDYFTALVTQAIVGNYDKAMGNAPHQGSKLSGFVHTHDLANSFMSFSTSYSDTG